MTQTVRLGVVGLGALGRHHARVSAAIPAAKLVAVYDIDRNRAEEVARLYDGARVASSLGELVDSVDGAIVAVPTVVHHEVARALLEASRHVLVEKPMTTTVAEGEDLLACARAKNVVLQVGHVERFNPAAEALRKITAARFVEVHRLSPFPNRSLDIDVILDLMIHDLDLLISLDGSEPVQVDAVGVPVLTDKVDIANVRIRFASGLIANLTASRVSMDKMRKFRVFGAGLYASCDFVSRQATLARRIVGDDGEPRIDVDQIGESRDSEGSTTSSEPLLRQAQAFVDAIRGAPVVVSADDGLRVLRLSHDILRRMATS